MEKFDRLTGAAAVMPQKNIDTDVIMPMGWLQRLDVNYGDGLFAGLRYRSDGTENPEFILNRGPFRKAKFIVAGENFGCGSSREWAVWALSLFGIRCVIAPSFGEIFANNCFRNGVLPIVLPVPTVERIAEAVCSGNPLSVDLESCLIGAADGNQWQFTIDPFRRDMLLAGVDEITNSLRYLSEIEAHENRDLAVRSWSYAPLIGKRAPRPVMNGGGPDEL